jgi:hypothetical protein
MSYELRATSYELRACTGTPCNTWTSECIVRETPQGLSALFTVIGWFLANTYLDAGAL